MGGGSARKRLCCPWILFLLFFSSCCCFWTDWKILLTNILWFVTQKACDQDRTHFIGHTKRCLRKILFSLLLFSKQVALETCLFTTTRIWSIWESTKNNYKLRNKFIFKMIEIELKEIEIELMSKRNKKGAQKNKLVDALHMWK